MELLFAFFIFIKIKLPPVTIVNYMK